MIYDGQARASADEYAATARRYGGLTRRWRLAPSEAAALAGCDEPGLHAFLRGAAPLTASSETRVRLLLDLDAALDRLLPLATCSAEWLRAAGPDCGGDTPLAFLSGPTAAIRAVRDGLAAVLEGRG